MFFMHKYSFFHVRIFGKVGRERFDNPYKCNRPQVPLCQSNPFLQTDGSKINTK